MKWSHPSYLSSTTGGTRPRHLGQRKHLTGMAKRHSEARRRRALVGVLPGRNTQEERSGRSHPAKVTKAAMGRTQAGGCVRSGVSRSVLSFSDREGGIRVKEIDLPQLDGERRPRERAGPPAGAPGRGSASHRGPGPTTPGLSAHGRPVGERGHGQRPAVSGRRDRPEEPGRGVRPGRPSPS